MTEIPQLLTRVTAQVDKSCPWGWPSLLRPLLPALYERVGDGGFSQSYGRRTTPEQAS
ncbi:hypothetical protein [Streptomyces fuscichromogenes]|uniref:Uncharacterized protein n=1 Tax=Streptomyces fuscichromogenes TaxID=1324013 RepID=A0A918CWU6_9ACTN|nr:hypothetical protein [Streptomyces fuscichromogenes]GGN41784.1 hypothetical protein GCM10011578_090440 [Streptomyces fuscichromogenes]